MKKYSSAAPYFPKTRMRRNRENIFSKLITAESTLSVNDLIMPLFVVEGKGVSQSIESMPNIFRYSSDKLLKVVEKVVSMEIPAIALFPKIEDNFKDKTGSLAYNSNNLICEAVRLIKSEFPNLGVICDVALDPYTDHGHDGLLINDQIDNDETIIALVKQSLVQAEAGCDAIAPSDMMDGRVSAIRDALDNKGFQGTQIISYAAKYASSFYGPFRDAVGSNNLKNVIDKSSYQMNPANSDEAMREISLDINEGADIIDIGGESTKPNFIDVEDLVEIKRLKRAFKLINKKYSAKIFSIDTRKSSVANFALKNGAAIFNDVSSLQFDPTSINVVKKRKCFVCLMHNSGNGKELHKKLLGKNYLLDIYDYLQDRINFLSYSL